MGQALYRKYRSKSLKDVVGQDHITKTLEQALKQGRVSHAYLFTGPRGVGKTSVARILAHAINDLPYTDDTPHIDIIEIDAASNRRIDEIRELREKVYVAPTSAKYKVYIIDEVHMLTREAFNALLKTLEEPPAHVVFILATTDAHKLPETIISRTQRFSFKPADKSTAANHLRHLAKAEKIKIDDEALELLAEHGGGSFRDSVSLLDQASSHGQAVTEQTVRQLLGLPPAGAVEAIWNKITASDKPADIVGQLDALYEQGYRPGAIAKQLQDIARRELITGQLSIGYEETLKFSEALLGVETAYNPERYLELAILRVLPPVSPRATPSSSPEEMTKAKPDAKIKTETKPAPSAGSIKDEALTTKPEMARPPSNQHEVIDLASWPEVLQVLKSKHNTLYGIVRMAQPQFNDSSLTLAFAFPFHQKRLNETNNRQKLADIIEQVTGQKVSIDCVVDKMAKPPAATTVKPKKAAPADSAANGLSAISNIFNGAELLES